MTACHPTQCQPRIYIENPPSPPLVKLKPLSKLPNVETPGAFDRNIRFSVPTHQRSTFDRAIAGLPPAFPGFPTTGEVFDDPAACKARLQGFSLSQGFAVVIGKSNKTAFEFL